MVVEAPRSQSIVPVRAIFVRRYDSQVSSRLFPPNRVPTNARPRAFGNHCMSTKLRRRLLGLEGPYADPRVAIDSLDNIRLWISGLSNEKQCTVFEEFVGFATDHDVQVATGAILSLDFLPSVFDSNRIVQVLRENSAKLQSAPQGFAAAYHSTLFEELFARLAQYGSLNIGAELERLLLSVPLPTRRSTLLVLLAPRFPQLVVYHSRRHLDSIDVQVLAALPEHSQRIAVSGALRPWHSSSITRAESTLQIRGCDKNDIQAILQVMRDQYPMLTHPPGLSDHRRWWIIADEPYNWTVWETDDGTLALEKMQPGPAYSSLSRLMSPLEASRFRDSRTIP